MANLNVIGNGFDLYHGLPTSYYYFACYLLSHNEDLYDDWADMYGFSKGIIHMPFEEFERKIDNLGYWSDFEKKLGELSSEWVEGTLLDDLDLENPEAVELEVDRPNHVLTMKRMLNAWIRETVDLEKNYRIVSAMIGSRKISFSDNDSFVSFNYTHTLEQIYARHNVFHIHEKSSSEEDNELIIGHGNDAVIEELEKNIDELREYDFEQPANNRIQEFRFEIDVLKELRKPVSQCISKLVAFLNNMEEPEFICVYGLSLGKVDIPYLKAIKRKWPNCTWKFSYYAETDKDRIREVTQTLSIPMEQYEIFEFKNLNSSEIECRIVEENHITQWPILSR